MNDEIWAAIKGFEGLYEISSQGRVASFQKGPRHILSPGPHTAGYLQVILSGRGIGKPRTLHRLVAEAFLGWEHGVEVNHKNGNKHDNRLENLELMTRSENILHRIHTLKASIGRRYKGSEHYNALLTEDKVLKIRSRQLDGLSYHKLAAEFGISKSTIAHVVRRHNWTHV